MESQQVRWAGLSDDWRGRHRRHRSAPLSTVCCVEEHIHSHSADLEVWGGVGGGSQMDRAAPHPHTGSYTLCEGARPGLGSLEGESTLLRAHLEESAEVQSCVTLQPLCSSINPDGIQLNSILPVREARDRASCNSGSRQALCAVNVTVIRRRCPCKEGKVPMLQIPVFDLDTKGLTLVSGSCVENILIVFHAPQYSRVALPLWSIRQGSCRDGRSLKLNLVILSHPSGFTPALCPP
ncbi:unnamed protein product [Arctogadus glacialis]